MAFFPCEAKNLLNVERDVIPIRAKPTNPVQGLEALLREGLQGSELVNVTMSNIVP